MSLCVYIYIYIYICVCLSYSMMTISHTKAKQITYTSDLFIVMKAFIGPATIFASSNNFRIMQQYFDQVSNSEFSFFWTGCFSKAKEPRLSYYLFIARRDGSIVFLWVNYREPRVVYHDEINHNCDTNTYTNTKHRRTLLFQIQTVY